MKAFLIKYGVYAIGIFLILAIIWIVYSHYSIAALENKNKTLMKANDVLKNEMKVQQAKWQGKFDGLELKAKQLEATVTQLKKSYAAVTKANADLQSQIDKLKIPVTQEGKLAKFKELGYEGEQVTAGTSVKFNGVEFSWVNTDKLLHDVMELGLVKELNKGLKEGNDLLQKTIAAKDEQIKNTEKEVRLALDRAEFAEKQGLAKDKIIADQGKVNADLVKKAKRGPLYFVGGVVVGIAITIAVFVGLGI